MCVLALRIISLAGIANLALYFIVPFFNAGNDKFRPKVQASALRSLIDETEYDCYFALKNRYGALRIVVQDADTIDLAVLDRLTFMKPLVRPSESRLNAKDEDWLLHYRARQREIPVPCAACRKHPDGTG